MRKVWSSYINANINSGPFTTIHSLTGEALNQIMGDILNGYSTKNVSIILLSFGNIQDIMKK